jgi:hypothetical protein
MTNGFIDYWAKYLGITDLVKNNDIVLPNGFEAKQIFRPYSVTTKTVSYYNSPKRRDPARRWK